MEEVINKEDRGKEEEHERERDKKKEIKKVSFSVFDLRVFTLPRELLLMGPFFNSEW